MELIYETFTTVAGTQYRKKNFEKAMGMFIADATSDVRLVREPENEHDHLAIKVYIFDIFIGYIPKKGNGPLRKLIRNEELFIFCKAEPSYDEYKDEDECILFIRVFKR